VAGLRWEGVSRLWRGTTEFAAVGACSNSAPQPRFARRSAVELKADMGGGTAVSKAARREVAEVGQGRARG
jgi:hypothetical protein